MPQSVSWARRLYKSPTRVGRQCSAPIRPLPLFVSSSSAQRRLGSLSKSSGSMYSRMSRRWKTALGTNWPHRWQPIKMCDAHFRGSAFLADNWCCASRRASTFEHRVSNRIR